MEKEIRRKITNLENIPRNIRTPRMSSRIGMKMADLNLYIHTDVQLMLENLVMQFYLVDLLVSQLIDLFQLSIPVQEKVNWSS